MMEKYFYVQLINLYPDKVIQYLNYDHPSLYQNLCSISREKKVTLHDLLNSMGFNYLTAKPGTPSSFDLATTKRLMSEFGVSQTEIANYLGTSRQAVNNKIIDETSGGSWESNELNQEEIELITNMVNSQVFELSEEGLVVSIKNNFHDICVIFIKDNEVKVIFNIPKNIDTLLKKNNYHIFSNEDIKIKANLISVRVLGIKMAKVRNQTTRDRIVKQCNKRQINIDDYVKLHGFDGFCSSRFIGDDEIERIIKKYVTKDNFVLFPHTSKDYAKLVNRASRANMNIDEFFEFFGYIKVDSRMESSYSNKIKQYVEEIKLFATGEGNQVYIKAHTNLYRRLYCFSKRRGISIDSLLMELGFERVYNSHDTIELENFNRDFDENNTNIKNLIAELETIQGDLERIVTIGERIKRSTALKNKLKVLYRCKCQLCSEEVGLPLIEKLDGSYYIEVHHITSLSAINDTGILEVDEETLDTFRNAIVVCPFHHKFLHYHHGGFVKLIRREDGIYFVSRKGTTIKVQLNFHL